MFAAAPKSRPLDVTTRPTSARPWPTPTLPADPDLSAVGEPPKVLLLATIEPRAWFI